MEYLDFGMIGESGRAGRNESVTRLLCQGSPFNVDYYIIAGGQLPHA